MSVRTRKRKCPAPGCGKPLVKRDGERNCQFAKRKFCGADCAYADKRVIAVEDRKCPAPGCGKPLVKRDGEKNFQFANRKFCGADCSYADKRFIAVEDRKCPAPKCGKPLVKRDGERNCQFVRRKSCDYDCANTARRTVVDIFGVELSFAKLARICDVIVSTVNRRVAQKRDPLTGYRLAPAKSKAAK